MMSDASALRTWEHVFVQRTAQRDWEEWCNGSGQVVKVNLQKRVRVRRSVRSQERKQLCKIGFVVPQHEDPPYLGHTFICFT